MPGKPLHDIPAEKDHTHPLYDLAYGENGLPITKLSCHGMLSPFEKDEST
jgi:hypothetical protein